MKPERAAQILAIFGALLLLVLFILRGYSLAKASLFVVEDEPKNAIPIESIPDGARLKNYHFQPGGDQVSFEQAAPGHSPAWYTIDIHGGTLHEGLISEPDNSAFLLEDEQVYARLQGSDSPVPVTPQRLRVMAIANAPDGTITAFTAVESAGRMGLYTVGLDGGLEWLGDEKQISAFGWSQDGAWLAYIAPRDGYDQVMLLTRSGAEIRQLTADPLQKNSLAWSPDGARIAYLARMDDEGASSVYLVELNGQPANQLTGPGINAVQISWIKSSGQLAYVARANRSADVEFLYVHNLAEATTRRAYPFLSINHVQCPASIPHGQEQPVQVTLTNSGDLPAAIPLALRTAKQPFDPRASLSGENRRRQAVRIETVDLKPGETRMLYWPVRGVSGVVTHASLVIDDDNAVFFSEQSCLAQNTYLGLPALLFLAMTAPLLLPGLLLVIPWIAQKKRFWLWILWLLVPLVLAFLVSAEIHVVRP